MLKNILDHFGENPIRFISNWVCYCVWEGTWARSILKNRMAVTESTKHQLSFELAPTILLVALGSWSFIESSLPVAASLFNFVLFCGLFSRSFPIKALTCSRSALDVVLISPKGRASSMIKETYAHYPVEGILDIIKSKRYSNIWPKREAIVTF